MTGSVATISPATAEPILREEVWNEHLVDKLEPFRQFLEVAAQASGQPVNASAIARDVGVDDKTVRKYFQILEDTLLGFFLEPFSRSVRKRQLQASKFYFFDLGVQKSLERSLRQQIVPGTFAFGRGLEHFIVLEMIRLNDAFRLDYRFSHLRTKDGVEIDLVVERPGEPPALVEIKSSSRTTRHDSRHLIPFLADIPGAVGYCVSLDPLEREIDGIRHLPWRKAFTELGLTGLSPLAWGGECPPRARPSSQGSSPCTSGRVASEAAAERNGRHLASTHEE